MSGKPSVDALFAMWKEIGEDNQELLVESDLRPWLRRQLGRVRGLRNMYAVLSPPRATLSDAVWFMSGCMKPNERFCTDSEVRDFIEIAGWSSYFPTVTEFVGYIKADIEFLRTQPDLRREWFMGYTRDYRMYSIAPDSPWRSEGMCRAFLIRKE